MNLFRKTDPNEVIEFEDVCDMRCRPKRKKKKKKVRPKDLVHEYMARAQIKLVDPNPAIYPRKVCGTAWLSLSQLLIGATVMTVLFFVLTLQMPLSVNAHILLCTVGYQLFTPLGILTPDGRETSAATLEGVDRKFQHYTLSIFGIVFGISGTVVAEFTYYDPKFPDGAFFLCYNYNDTIEEEIVTQKSLIKKITPFLIKGRNSHSIAAWVAAVFGVCALISGPFSVYSHLYMPCGGVVKILHALFGVLCFVTSSASFALGLLDIRFDAWLQCAHTPETLYIIFCFCTIYTILVALFPLAKIIRGYTVGYPL